MFLPNEFFIDVLCTHTTLTELGHNLPINSDLPFECMLCRDTGFRKKKISLDEVIDDRFDENIRSKVSLILTQDLRNYANPELNQAIEAIVMNTVEGFSLDQLEILLEEDDYRTLQRIMAKAFSRKNFHKEVTGKAMLHHLPEGAIF